MATGLKSRPPYWTIHPNPPRVDIKVNWSNYSGTDVFKVALLGDSHGKRTAFYLPPHLPVCKRRLFEIKDFSEGGATARDINYTSLLPLLEWKPHITILFIGGNDLDTSAPCINRDPICPLVDIFNILGVNGHYPLVMGVPNRLTTRHITVEEYDKRVRRANYILQRKLGGKTGDRFIKLPYMFYEDFFVQEDGVHFNMCAYEEAAQAIKDALWELSENDARQLRHIVRDPKMPGLEWVNTEGVWMTDKWSPSDDQSWYNTWYTVEYIPKDHDE